MIKQYDFHVATDSGADSSQLRNQLLELGFHDDNLVKRGLIYDKETAQYYSSCPLIDIHMSKKITDLHEMKKMEESVHMLLEQSDCAGYWHSEYTDFDAHVMPEPEDTFSDRFGLPFEQLKPKPRDIVKKWDLHIAFSEKNLSEELKRTLIDAGLYYLIRRKKRGDFAIFTVQGVNAPEEGRKFAQKLIWWLGKFHVPPFDFKFELTVNMQTVHNPQLVPPTIDHVIWR